MSNADLVFLGATIEPIVRRRSGAADALAVRDGHICALGASADVRELIGPRTRVVQLRGETLLPGFQDAHVHPIDGGLAALRCELHDLADADAYLEAVARYATAHPDLDWIVGSGWSMPAFPGGTPRRELLDRVVPHRPVFLDNRDGHGAWVNSRALELAGIGPSTPDPVDGRIERDADGTPSGTLHEGAMALVEDLVPPPTGEDLVAALLEGQRRLHALGITAWQDAIVRPDAMAAYKEVTGDGRLTARVLAAQSWERDQGIEQIEAFVERRASAEGGKLRAGAVKLMLDGVIENFTAALLDPYLGRDGAAGTNRGLLQIDAQTLMQAVPELDRRGLQAHFHAIGDRAVRAALDAIEAARRANGARDLRHHVAHIQLIHPDDLPRFAELGAVATMQPFWACHEPQMDDLTIPFLGQRRAGLQYPFASLLRAGARLAGGSDWPVTTANPLLEIEVAVTRCGPDSRGAAPLLPDERLSLDQALAAFTVGAAHANHLDVETGSLEIGKRADVVVLDRNLRDHEAGPLGEARVVGTWIDGAAVYEAD